MINYTTLLESNRLFTLLRELADAQRVPTYVVGGFVRDKLLQRQCKDIDIVCVGDNIPLVNAFAQAIGNATVKVFANFGTAMVQWKDFQVEFVNARKESYAHDSRKPRVVLGTLEDDLMRRDFTLNALAIGLNSENFGDLVDLFDGLSDLQAKVIRTPLDPVRTFSDDPLRMLRGVRFATQLGFRLTEATKKAMVQEGQRLRILSKERIITELNSILLSPAPVTGLRLLDEVGLLKRILPEMEALKGAETIYGFSHKDNFVHTLQVVHNLVTSIAGAAHPKRLWLIWAAILHDIAKPATKRFDPRVGFTFHGHEYLGAKMIPCLFKRLGLPMKGEMRYVQKLVKMHLRHIPLVGNDITDAAIRRFLYDAGEELEDLLLLCRADITSGNVRKVVRYVANFDTLAIKIKEVESKDRVRNLQPVISGDDIMELFRLKPCKEVGRIKKAIKEAILDGKISNTYEEAYAYMLTFAKQIDLEPATV